MVELDLFGDIEESVYRHYEHEIRKNMQAGAVLQQAAADLDTERAAHAQTRTALADAQARLKEMQSKSSQRSWWRRWSDKYE
jgi:hypothetical protein